MSTSSTRAFRWFSWASLGYMFLVIAWGAFVRATGSGAGCGDHWPTCNGEVIPRAPSVQTLIEFAHRLTSGLAGLVVLVQLVWSFRAFPRRHPVRSTMVGVLVFLVLEGAIGAGLVLFEWVAHDVSVGRALGMGVHLINTFLLLFSCTAVCFYAYPERAPLGVWRRWLDWGWVGLGLVAVLLTGLSGTVAALGDTLLLVSVPQGAVSEGHWLLQVLLELRILHPLIAVAGGAVVLLAASRAARGLANTRPHVVLAALVVAQWGLGMLNVALKAPVWLQLVHLLLADAIWTLLVWVGLTQLSQPSPAAQTSVAPRPSQQPV